MTVQILFLVLTSVALGAVLPVLFEFRSTLRSIRLQVERSGPVLDRCIERVDKVAKDVEGITSGFRGGEEHAKRIVHQLGDTADSIERVNQAVRTGAAIGSSVGPAVSAFVSALRESGVEAHANQQSKGELSWQTETMASQAEA